MNVTMINNEDTKALNRNSLDDDDEDSDGSDGSDDPFNDVDEDVISADFEAFSDTDTEANDDCVNGDDEVSDSEAEAELFDHFDENPPPRRSSCDDILEAVQAVKLNYSFPFQSASISR